MTDFTLYDGLDELRESEAMKQGALDRYGIFNIRFIRFDKANKWKKQTNAEGKEYSTIVEITKAQAAQLTKQGGEVGSQYVIELNAQDLGGKFNYQRGVAPKSPDMKLTVIPSVRALMGDKEADLEKVLAWLAERIGKYAHIEEVPEVDYDGKQKASEDEKVYRAPKFIEFYADKAACQAAFVARWGGKQEPVNTTVYPPTPQEDKENGAYTHAQWDAQIPTVQKYLRLGYSPEAIAGEGKLPNGKFGFGVPVECITSLQEEQVPA